MDALGLVGQVDVEVGTLSKAVGSLGGFCCCSTDMRRWLLNRGRSFVYSTALPVRDVHMPAACTKHLGLHRCTFDLGSACGKERVQK